MNDDSDWQAFGERVRRGTGTPSRPTFGGFDWQSSGETATRTPSDTQDVGPTAPRATAAGRPPIRTAHGTGPASTPDRGEAHATSNGRRTGGDAPSAPADSSGTEPAQSRTGSGPEANARSASGAQDTRRPEPANSGAPYPGSIPPPPPASARFPDTPPASGHREPRAGSGDRTVPPSRSGTDADARTAAPGPMPPAARPQSRPTDSGTASAPPRPRSQPSVPPRPARAPAETASETTFRMRPVPTASAPRAHPTAVPAKPDARPAPTALTPDPALSWSAALPPHDGTPGNGRPVVSFGEPEVGYKERSWGVRIPPRIAAVAACVVLGLGLIGGAVTGSWLTGDAGDEGSGDTFAAAGELWHSVPVDQLFPMTVDGQGAGPGGADRTWTRIAVAPDSGCQDAFDPLLRKALAPVGCERLLRATYADATQSYVTTVGLLFTDADAAAMRALDTRFTKEGLETRTDLMPLPYAAKNTLAADFGARQRASWTISVLTDAPVVAYAVSGWADGRTVDAPEPAEQAMESGDTTPAAQSGLGNEAQGLADRVERALRKTVTSPSEQPS